MQHMLEDARQNWLIVVGILVVLGALVLVTRALRRRARYDGSSPEEFRERRGRLTEDVLTIAVACIAAALSAHALIAYAQTTLGLSGGWRLLPFGGLDTAAVVCAIRARRRANAGQAAGINSVLVWVLAGISAMFSASASAGVWGAVGHGIWALVAATLWELGLLEQRRQRQERPDRSLGLIRWLHPWERVQVLAELAADTDITADEATTRVRERRAARTLYLLNLADAAHRTSGREQEPRALRRAERRAQRAAARVRLAEAAVEAQVMPQLRVLCEVRQIAATGGRPRQSVAVMVAPSLAPATPPRHDNAPSAGTVARHGLDDVPQEVSVSGAQAVAPGPVPAPSAATAAEPEPVLASAVADHADTAATVAATVPVGAAMAPSPAAQGAAVAVGSMALDVMAAGVPRQSQTDASGVGELDPRVLRLLEQLETDAGMTGADAARELGVPTRTGQRLLRSAKQLQQALQMLARDPSVSEEHLARELGADAREAARLHGAAVAELARRAAIGHRRLRSVDRGAVPVG